MLAGHVVTFNAISVLSHTSCKLPCFEAPCWHAGWLCIHASLLHCAMLACSVSCSPLSTGCWLAMWLLSTLLLLCPTLACHAGCAAVAFGQVCPIMNHGFNSCLGAYPMWRPDVHALCSAVCNLCQV